MNARKRAKRRTERSSPTYLLQGGYKPTVGERIKYRLPVRDGNLNLATIEVTGEQAKKFGFTEGLIQPEIAEQWQRSACTAREKLKEQAAMAAVSARIHEELKAAGEAAQRVLYRERAVLVAWLSTRYPCAYNFSDPESPDWPVVFVETMEGQVSWHVAPADMGLFAHVRRDDTVVWDGHSTEEKYARIERLIARIAGSLPDD